MELENLLSLNIEYSDEVKQALEHGLRCEAEMKIENIDQDEVLRTYMKRRCSEVYVENNPI